MHIPTDYRRISMNEELGEHFGYYNGKDAQEAVEIYNELMRKTKPDSLCPVLFQNVLKRRITGSFTHNIYHSKGCNSPFESSFKMYTSS